MDFFVDTETTGLVNFKERADHESQPHLVQLGGQFFDGRNLVGELNLIVKPAIPIPPEASAVHGITDQVAAERGCEPEQALAGFLDFYEQTDRLIAHNMSFDWRVLLAALYRATSGTMDRFQRASDRKVKRLCTMRTATNVLKLPGRYGFKWPTLDEAYRALVDPKGFEGAHDALTDVKACAEVFWALEDRGCLLAA